MIVGDGIFVNFTSFKKKSPWKYFFHMFVSKFFTKKLV